MTCSSKRLHRWLAVCVVVTLCACSDSSAPLPADDINTFTASLPTWDQFSPPKPDSEYIRETGVAETNEQGDDGTMYKCHSTPYSLTRTPDKVVTLDPDVNILWLGALLQGSGYKDGIGSLAEWSVRERAPLQISLDLLSAPNSKIVEKPTLASVNQAIGELVQSAQTAGHRGGSSIAYSSQTTHSVFQAALHAGYSSKYFSKSISGQLDAQHKADKQTVTAYFVQRMFTASIVLPNRSSDMFGPTFTSARLQQEIDAGHAGSSNPPVYIANIVYGRILVFSFTSAATIDSIRIALNVVSSLIKDTVETTVDIDPKISRILETADIRVVTVGGEGRNALNLIRSGKVSDFFNEDAALTSARPISYTVRNLGDNSIAKVSETTEYNLKECAAIPTTGQLHVDVTPNDARVAIAGPGGYSFTSTGDQLLTELTPGGYSVVVSRQGFDTARIETSVNAGDVTELPVTLRDPAQTITGGIYAIRVSRIILDDVSCAETLPDLYHDIAILSGAGSRTLTRRARDNYVELPAGAWDYAERTPSPDVWATVADTVFFTNKGGTTTDTLMTISGTIKDNDGISADDVMAGFNRRFYKTGVPTGSGLISQVGANGCGIRLEFSIERTGSMFN